MGIMNSGKSAAIAKHQEMWLLLVEHPEWEKTDALAKMGYSFDQVRSDCFLCGYSGEDCERCPLLWPSKTGLGGCLTVDREEKGDNGLYALWDDATDPDLRSKLARLIAYLPVNTKIE